MKEEAETSGTPVVLLHDENVEGVVKQLGAYVSLVVYQKAGHEFQVWVDNDEFTIIGYIGFVEEEVE